MTIREVMHRLINKIAEGAIFISSGKSVFHSIATCLQEELEAGNYPELDRVIPGITEIDVEQWYRNLFCRLVICEMQIRVGDQDSKVLEILTEALPEIYRDLIRHSKIPDVHLGVPVH